jgi:hypothetical protein
MIDEYKTHYSEMKTCDRLGEEVLVEQIKASEVIIAQCNYRNLDRCEVDPDNPIPCSLGLTKLVRIVRD